MPDPRWHLVLILMAPAALALIAASAAALLRGRRGVLVFTTIALLPAFAIQLGMLWPGRLLATTLPSLDPWLIQANYWTASAALLGAAYVAWQWWPRRAEAKALLQPAPWSWASRIALAMALPVFQLPALILATAGDDVAELDKPWRIARIAAAVVLTPLAWLLPSAPMHAVACAVAALLPGPWRSLLATAAVASLMGWLL